ncbi:MAG: transglutaminase TgpA family protein [Chloroflexia bacterium]
MIKYFRLREGWLTLGLLALLLFSVVWSIQRGGWSDDLFILTPITLAGMATALVLSRLRGVPRLLLHLTGGMAGLALVLWLTSNLIYDPRLLTIQDRVLDLWLRLFVWARTVMNSDMSDDSTLFVFSLAVFTWILSYTGTWFVFRSRWLWWVLIPTGLALVINISYSSQQLGWYFILYVFTALLLMVRFNTMVHEERWERERVNYSPSLSASLLRYAGIFALLVALVMWPLSLNPSVNSTLNSAWNHINGPWEDLQQRWSNAFATVNGNGNFGYASFNESFTLGGALHLGDGVALKVKTDRPLYWRAMTYDSFSGRGWNNTAAQTFRGRNLSSLLSLDAGQLLRTDDTMRVPVTATVQVMHPRDKTLWAPLAPSSINLPTRLSVSWQDLNATYSVPGSDPNDAPIELQPLLSLLADARREALPSYQVGGMALPSGSPDEIAQNVLAGTSQAPAIATAIYQLRDRGINASYWFSNPFTFVVRAEGQVPVYDDLSAIESVGRMDANQSYTVESLVTNADKESLRQAGTDYPKWVRDRYLSLSPQLPQRVAEKALQVVNDAGAVNPYDKAWAIQQFLRQYPYNTDIPDPPTGRNLVDYFLFDGKQGYCTYYSSAMVVMLRSLGIPAREAVGYAPGEYDSSTQVWTIKESAAHAWPEVYFQNIGWVEFEPTPSQSVIDRPDSQADANASPTPFAGGTPPAQPTHKVRDDNPTPSPVSGTAATTAPPPSRGGTGAGIWIVLLLLGVAGIFFVREALRRRAIESGRLVLGGIQYYERLLRFGWLLGLRASPADTPFEFAEQVGREVPGAGVYVEPIAEAYLRERFGRHQPDRAEQQQLAQTWSQLRNRLLLRLTEVRRRLWRSNA